MARPSTLPIDAPTDEQIVCHVDADCFYVACERLREPTLRGEPVIVGMGYEAGESHGAVATASYEAREHGVQSAQSIEAALETLPRRGDADTDEPTAYYRPVDMDFYESVSDDIRTVLEASADVVRPVSIDEAYLDVTDRTDWETVASFGAELKATIRERAGIVVSVGIAPTMSAAKIASDAQKPDGLTLVEPGEVRSFLAPLDVEAIHNVGPATARKLRGLGIETAADLASADPDRLTAQFGERGRAIYRYARGEDGRDVTPRDDPKSFSRESAFSQPVADHDQLKERVQTLASAVADRAARNGALYQTIGIKVVEPPYDVHTRARSLSGPVADPALLEDVARDLLTEFEGTRVRKVGVRVSKLSFTDREQVALSGFDTGAGSDDTETTATERTPPGEHSDGVAATEATPADADEGATSPEPTDSPHLSGQTTLSDFG
ncbi:DNA polymerase IV [Halorhabdus sp. CUG00001]|uniref:DNA polymerase IV n=1 Tax=Halorhabdus sp. CUG00001 TaxID=2600297 RepID=UPI00131A6A3B|nr:DNA polymerase IV [Halorhabdus sp. CUG00001]